MARLGIDVLPSFNETVPLWCHHRSNGRGHECMHACFPGIPQTWIATLARTLRGRRQEAAAGAPRRPRRHDPFGSARYPCGSVPTPTH